MNKVMSAIWIFLIVVAVPVSAFADPATLVLTVVNDSTGEPTPARVEILASDDKYYVADDALLVGGDCDMSDKDAGLVDLETTLAHFSKEIWNP